MLSEMERRSLIENVFREHISVLQTLFESVGDVIISSGLALYEALAKGQKVLICGNGGSAADAQHFAAELAGRFEKERQGLPGIALTTDTSALTAIGNDYGFERIFARQVEALGRRGDVLVAISTSGNSPNVVSATESARAAGMKVIGLTGGDGGMMKQLCDHLIAIPSRRTARIQEMHITVIHIWCDLLDREFGND
jgi:D-sedoheptulose 7-phosphate isomerase